MVWGTALLFCDCILMILLYEQSRAWLSGERVFRGSRSPARCAQLRPSRLLCRPALLTGAPLSVLFGGWVAKMAAVAIYSVLVGCYLRRLERAAAAGAKRPPRVSDVFDLLTYRERYEDLLARTGRDALTGAFDRGRLELLGGKPSRRRCRPAGR